MLDNTLSQNGWEPQTKIISYRISSWCNRCLNHCTANNSMSHKKHWRNKFSNLINEQKTHTSRTDKYEIYLENYSTNSATYWIRELVVFVWTVQQMVADLMVFFKQKPAAVWFNGLSSRWTQHAASSDRDAKMIQQKHKQ